MDFLSLYTKESKILLTEELIELYGFLLLLDF